MGQWAFVSPHQHYGADYGDRIERVGDRHQWGVKKRRDAFDDFKPNEPRQHEYEETVD